MTYEDMAGSKLLRYPWSPRKIDSLCVSGLFGEVAKAAKAALRAQAQDLEAAGHL